jgi:hypothetical protein
VGRKLDTLAVSPDARQRFGERLAREQAMSRSANAMTGGSDVFHKKAWDCVERMAKVETTGATS